MIELPENFLIIRDHIVNDTKKVSGIISIKEMRFLCLLAMMPTTAGEILEIGSFRGKSTIVLAKSIFNVNKLSKLYAVDPMVLSSTTDPDYKSSLPLYDDFINNLQAHNVDSIVEFYKMKSEELGKSWNRRLRLLWIDGDHNYLGAKRDLETFLPFLNPGAIIAIHDVLHRFDGPVRIMAEHILLSNKFGAFGFCNSIGWAQYLGDAPETQVDWKRKIKYYKILHRFIPFLATKRKMNLLYRCLYKLNNACIPHGDVEPRSWLKEVKFFNPNSL